MKKINNWLVLVMSLCLAGCSIGTFSSESNFKIGKVNTYDRKVSLKLEEQNFSRAQGLDKFFIDAETLEDEEVGEKFVVKWKYTGKQPTDVVLRVQYKTAKVDRIVAVEEKYSALKKGRYSYTVEHLGDAFKKEGPIAVWRIDIISNGQVVATKESVLWADIERRKSSLS